MCKKSDFPIDFVITWVNQNDQAWFNKKQKYSKLNTDEEDKIRYRDYGTLRYLFRSIEKYASWVNRIFLITDHQVPKWLNVDNEKIVIINHEDYIQSKFLPTFNSNVIDLNLCNIRQLSEHFVYFNDDMFLNDWVKPTDFFSNEGKPMDSLALNYLMPSGIFDHTYVNNIAVINSEFSKKDIIKKFWNEIFTPKNHMWALLSLLQFPLPRFSRFYDSHIQLSFRKSVFKEFVQEHKYILNVTNQNKFRSATDYSIWVIRYYQMLTGQFKSRSIKIGQHYALDDIVKVVKDIKTSQHQLINVNDADGMTNEEYVKAINALKSAFELKLGSKCSFEL